MAAPHCNILKKSQSYEETVQPEALPPELKANSPEHVLEIQLSPPGRAPSPTSQSEGQTTWKVAYYVVCLLAVVAVWGVMLLPPILTYSFFRSPLPEPLEEAYTVNLTNATPNSSMSKEDSESTSQLNQSGLSIPSDPGNCSATSSNYSRECSVGFYLHRELDSCRPQCGILEPSLSMSTSAIIASSIGPIFGIALLVISALQWKRMFVFPSIFWVFIIINNLLSGLVGILGLTNPTWFCTSVDLIDNILNPSPYCTLSGILSNYLLFQLILLVLFLMVVFFWVVVFPFQYQAFTLAGRFKYVYTAMVIAVILLPCLTALINLIFGYGTSDFPAIQCRADNQGVAFFTEALPEAIEIAIIGTLLVLVILTLLKHSINKKTRNQTKRLTAKEKWILLFMLYILVIGCLNSVAIAYRSATLNSSKQILQDYFRCESAGRQMNCSVEDSTQSLQGLYTTISVLDFLLPVFILPLLVNIKELRRICKHINTVIHSHSCTSKQK